MNFEEYAKAAKRTAPALTNERKLGCSAMGLTGEAGEYADHIKKHLYQGHDIQHEKAAEELGDVLWYLALAADSLGFSLDEIAYRNIDKLKKRYPDGFSSERSKSRKH